MKALRSIIIEIKNSIAQSRVLDTRQPKSILRFITRERSLFVFPSCYTPFTISDRLFASKDFKLRPTKKRTLTNLFRYVSRIIHLLFYARGQLDEEGISYSIPLFSLPELKNAYVTQFDARITRREYKKKKNERNNGCINIRHLFSNRERNTRSVK